MDITKADPSTDFEVSLLEWIRSSDVVVLAGTTSYATRSKDSTTLTFGETVEIGKKKQINSNSIIPVLFEGRFASSFPPGYQDTIGGRFSTPTDYMKDLPGVAAAILGITNDKEVSDWLETYTKEAESIIKGAKPSLSIFDQIKSNLTIQQQYWKSRLLVLHSKFTLDQLRKIDGNVNKRTILMNGYHEKIIKDIQNRIVTVSIPEKKIISQVEPHLRQLVASATSKVLAIFSHRFIPSLFDALALLVCEGNGVVPIFIDLASIENPTSECVQQSLSKQGLDLSTIEQSKREREFILFVSGFGNCGIHTNFYVRNEMSTWNAKVVFSCPAEYQRMNPNINFYFMPSNLKSHQLPNPEGLLTVLADDSCMYLQRIHFLHLHL